MFAGVLIGVALSAVSASDSLTKKDALAKYGAAVWQARRDRLVSAAKSLEAASKLDPDATAPRRELVRVYAQIGREPDAIRVARKVLETTPTDVDTAHTLAKLLHDVGELKEAAAAAKLAADSPAIADRPDKALAVLRDLATLLEATNDPAGAEDALRKAVSLLLASRKSLVASGKFTAKEVDADHAALLERLGKVMVKQTKYEAATEAYRAAFKLVPDDQTAAGRLNWHLSVVLAAKGDRTNALAHLEGFIKHGPRSVEPFERLAAMLRDADRGSEVTTKLQQCLGRDPGNLHLKAVLAAELARNAATRGRADELFAEVSEVTNDPKVVRFIVRSHLESGRAGLVVAAIDAGYAATKGDDPANAGGRQFAADKVKAIADVLRAEPDWTEAVVRAAHDELRGGTKRLHATWHVMGVLAAHHRKLDFAATLFRQAISMRQRDSDPETYSGLINVHWRANQPAEVVRVCEEGLRGANISPSWLNSNLASAYAHLGDAENALTAVDKAIAQAAAGDRLAVRLRKAAVLKTLGKWDDASSLCRKLLDEFGTPAEQARIRYALASALWGAKKYAEAEAELRAILDDDPDHAGACNDLGYHLADQGRNLPEAEKLIRHAIAVDRLDRRKAGDPEPDNAAYLDSLGWVLFRRGNLGSAKEQLEKAAALPDGATDPTVWDHLGDVYFRLGEKAKAKTAWGTAARLYATDPRGKRDKRGESVARKLKQVE
jgi:tetratricopeptide (TPR) repeat protein